jgi:hypothetical protein
LNFTGSGGDFGTVCLVRAAVQRKVTENWLKYEVDPRISEATRVFLIFDIARDGHQPMSRLSSRAVPSLDQSAVRALQRIDTFRPAAIRIIQAAKYL